MTPFLWQRPLTLWPRNQQRVLHPWSPHIHFLLEVSVFLMLIRCLCSLTGRWRVFDWFPLTLCSDQCWAPLGVQTLPGSSFRASSQQSGHPPEAARLHGWDPHTDLQVKQIQFIIHNYYNNYLWCISISHSSTLCLMSNSKNLTCHELRFKMNICISALPLRCLHAEGNINCSLIGLLAWL